MRRIAQGAAYWLWRATSALAQRVPTRVAYAVALAGGELAYRLWAEKRHIAQANLATVLGRDADDPEVARVTRRSFRNFAKYVVEIMRFPSLTREDIARLVTIPEETWTHLQEARAGGRGVIIASIHYGNFELAGARLAEQIPLSVVADDIGNARLMDLLTGNRSHKNITLFTPDGAAKKVLRALRRNEIVGFMVDLGPRAMAFSNVEADFFGRPTRFPAIVAELARASGAPIVVATATREPGGTFHTRSLPPIRVGRTAEAASEVQRGIQDVARAIETLLRRRPDQWYIFRPMWPSAKS